MHMKEPLLEYSTASDVIYMCTDPSSRPRLAFKKSELRAGLLFISAASKKPPTENLLKRLNKTTWIFYIGSVLFFFLLLLLSTLDCRISNWSLSLRASQPEHTSCRFTPTMTGEGAIKPPQMRILLQWCLHSKPCQEKSMLFTPHLLLKWVICRVTRWRKDDKISLSLSGLKYHRCHPCYFGDWQPRLPGQQGEREVVTEAWVAVMILHGVMKRVYSISNLWSRLMVYLPWQNLVWRLLLLLFISHREPLHCTENGNFQSFLSCFLQGYNMLRRSPKHSLYLTEET